MVTPYKTIDILAEISILRLIQLLLWILGKAHSYNTLRGYEMNDRKGKIKSLEAQAAQILEAKKSVPLRRPIVIEFCGMPKSGKTTSIESLNIFLRRNKIRSTVIAERAAVNKIPNKIDPSFNLWNLTSTLGELLEKRYSEEYDVIILDRGLFDALCWLDWQVVNGYLRVSEREKFANFILSDTLRGTIDIVYLFDVDEKTAIYREHASLLTDKRGSIMREAVLSEYKKSMGRAKKNYGKNFRSVIDIDTTNLDQTNSAFLTTKGVLDEVTNLLVEKIGYFPKTTLSEVVSKYTEETANILGGLQFNARPIVEENEKLKQPIPIAVLKDKNSNRVIIGQKRDESVDKKGPEYRRQILYFGGHTRQEDDLQNDGNIESIFRRCLERELREELNIPVSLDEDLPKIIIQTSNNATSRKHMAVVFVVEVDFSTTKLRPNKVELSTDSKVKTGTIINLDDVEQLKKYKFCDWSKVILKDVFNIDGLPGTEEVYQQELQI